ncbi:SRPBCC family protein [Mycobacterium simiae]|uniref:SRPBCC family protein n=1 Tax=Mycobacterium simiae TaxID=1784 RepID=A0A5B1BTK6_MYCSI|nr:SRPBCC family protein [Mycobacterium simiae]KAA1252198.1 SRPBCC family protein [Mycobacterium simiae]
MTATEKLTASREVTTSSQTVWDVLANGWTYAQWVVGNSRTRAVDSHWPEPGSVIRHSIGVWPLVINDQTMVAGWVPGRELVLRAGLGRLGAARITMRVTDSPQGCRVDMIEMPVEGPVGLIPNRLALAAIYPRNRECLLRLAALAERLQPSNVK